MNKKYWLTNVLLETGFIYTGHEITGTETAIHHLLIENGSISRVQTQVPEQDGTPFKDAHGLLAIPSFCDKHLHLDKGFYGGPWQACTAFNSVAARIREEEEFLPHFVPDTSRKAQALLELVTASGVTHARIQCNVDPVVGLANMEQVQLALEANTHKLTYELVAFPQHGLLKSNTISLMKDAMRSGVNIVGGLDPATIDNDIAASLHSIMELAVEFNAPVDIHLHDRGALGMYTIRRLSQMVEDAKWQGRVTVSHAYCLGDAPAAEVAELAERLAALDISIVTTCPIDVNAPPVPLLHGKGVKVSLANDNIHDHWSPYGDGDMLHRANRLGERFKWITEYQLNRALGFITEGMLPLNSQGEQVWPKAGHAANMVFTNASCSAEAVARRTDRKAVMFQGQVVSGQLQQNKAN